MTFQPAPRIFASASPPAYDVEDAERILREGLAVLRATPGLPTAAAQAVHEALQQFEQAAGGRPKLIAAFASGAGLLHEAQGVAVDRLLSVLADPRAADLSLGQIARYAKMSMPELIRLYKDSRIAVAHMCAIDVMAEGARAITESILEQALPKEIVCGHCEGLTTIVPRATKAEPNPDPVPCKACKGSGVTIRPPDLEAQKVALTLVGLLDTKKSSIAFTLTNTVTTQQNLITDAGTFAKMQQASDEILYRQKPIRSLPASTESSTPEPPDAPPEP